MLVEVIPELGFGQQNEHTMSLLVRTIAVTLLTTPEVNKTRECHLIVEEVQPPYTCQLEACERVSAIIALDELLIQSLHRPCL